MIPFVRVCLTLLIGVISVSTAGIVRADGAPSEAQAQRSFDAFAQSWMAKLERHASDGRKAGGPAYRSYTREWQTELRPTGHKVAPWVGLLRYGEENYTCGNGNGKAAACSLSSTTPVMEIFRFQDGRWVY
jgi:hypothetical protein